MEDGNALPDRKRLALHRVVMKNKSTNAKVTVDLTVLKSPISTKIVRKLNAILVIFM